VPEKQKYIKVRLLHVFSVIRLNNCSNRNISSHVLSHT